MIDSPEFPACGRIITGNPLGAGNHNLFFAFEINHQRRCKSFSMFNITCSHRGAIGFPDFVSGINIHCGDVLKVGAVADNDHFVFENDRRATCANAMVDNEFFVPNQFSSFLIQTPSPIAAEMTDDFAGANRGCRRGVRVERID